MNCLGCGKYIGKKEYLGKRKTCSDKCRKAKSRKLKGIKMKKRIYIDLHIASVGFRQHSMERDDKGVFVSCENFSYKEALTENMKEEDRKVVASPVLSGQAIDEESIMINETCQICKVIRQYDEWPNG